MKTNIVGIKLPKDSSPQAVVAATGRVFRLMTNPMYVVMSESGRQERLRGIEADVYLDTVVCTLFVDACGHSFTPPLVDVVKAIEDRFPIEIHLQ